MKAMNLPSNADYGLVHPVKSEPTTESRNTDMYCMVMIEFWGTVNFKSLYPGNHKKFKLCHY